MSEVRKVNLTNEIELLKNSPVKKTVDARMKEFERVGRSSSETIFSELCFCILTANFNAERTIKIQQEMKQEFAASTQEMLARRLKQLGHRFPNARAKYIFEARKFAKGLKKKIHSFENERIAREWLVENVNGLGFKEASHFLRNIGFKNVAIIDFHILDLLARSRKMKKLKGKILNKKNYLRIEELLEEIGEKCGLSLAELDLYLWFLETGKVLK
ncbi:N-glycosylase/DNA lyase [Candidatus Micrarchaeota archaeon]|nr:N-glycosylase/DNA lyase [Candidatus Micrarchaeota archaeon]